MPINAGVVTSQPRKAQHQLEVGQIDKLKGNLLSMLAMNANAGRVKMGDGGGKTAINKLNRDGVGVWYGLQKILA